MSDTDRFERIALARDAELENPVEEWEENFMDESEEDFKLRVDADNENIRMMES